MSGPSKNKTIIFKGVSRDGNRWRANTCKHYEKDDEEKYSIRRCLSEIDCAHWYDNMAKQGFNPEFAYLNFHDVATQAS